LVVRSFVPQITILDDVVITIQRVRQQLGREGVGGESGVAAWSGVDGWPEVAGSVWAVAVGSVALCDGLE
jgi:hypothetical protein